VDERDEHHMLRLVETFMYKNHFIFVTEMLGIDLYSILKQNRFRGFAINLLSKVIIYFITAILINVLLFCFCL
jgi:tetrahydromethanopterin S-methyltransferase subunit F